jgi:hypothetical protein
MLPGVVEGASLWRMSGSTATRTSKISSHIIASQENFQCPVSKVLCNTGKKNKSRFFAHHPEPKSVRGW